MRLKPEVLEARKAFAKSVNYDIALCRKEWRIRIPAVKYFIREFCLVKKVLKKPEYENQQLFDLHVLNRFEWCRKYSIPFWEYDRILSMFEKEHGRIATPEVRERWMQEYWESLEE